jgi:hypothetical protein
MYQFQALANQNTLPCCGATDDEILFAIEMYLHLIDCVFGIFEKSFRKKRKKKNKIK